MAFAVNTLSVKVILIYKSYTTNPNVSHAGLGICAINTSKTLIQANIASEVWPIETETQIAPKIALDPTITHVVIQAPWVSLTTLNTLAQAYTSIQFAVNCHSNVGFLQTDPYSMANLLQVMDLEQTTANIHVAGNSQLFTNWMGQAYQSKCTLLPNLYYLDNGDVPSQNLWTGGPLRIGIFGAPRPQKNVMTGVAAAILIAQKMKAHTEIWVNSGRNETHGKTILQACQTAISRNPFCSYNEFPWAPWPQFRAFVGTMDLLIQVSYSESFNQVTADGIATGVPSVVGSAIRWAPSDWIADTDDPGDVAKTGMYLLRDPLASWEGLQALNQYNQRSLQTWKKYLRAS
jgi:hypothetical protein